MTLRPKKLWFSEAKRFFSPFPLTGRLLACVSDTEDHPFRCTIRSSTLSSRRSSSSSSSRSIPSRSGSATIQGANSKVPTFFYFCVVSATRRYILELKIDRLFQAAHPKAAPPRAAARWSGKRQSQSRPSPVAGFTEFYRVFIKSYLDSPGVELH